EAMVAGGGRAGMMRQAQAQERNQRDDEPWCKGAGRPSSAVTGKHRDPLGAGAMGEARVHVDRAPIFERNPFPWGAVRTVTPWGSESVLWSRDSQRAGNSIRHAHAASRRIRSAHGGSQVAAVSGSWFLHGAHERFAARAVSVGIVF